MLCNRNRPAYGSCQSRTDASFSGKGTGIIITGNSVILQEAGLAGGIRDLPRAHALSLSRGSSIIRD